MNGLLSWLMVGMVEPEEMEGLGCPELILLR